MKKTIICCLFAIALLLSACGPRTQETVETTAPMTETVVEECVAAASEAAPEGSATAPPETTVPPSTSPEMTTEPLPAPQLHSGLMEDGSFSEGVLFLGDSQTCIFVEQYLKPQGVLGGAKTAAQCGASVNHFWNEDVRPSLDRSVFSSFSQEFEGMNFQEAVAAMGQDATAIYIMLGSNYVADSGAEGYIKIVDWILETCPNATVHLQTIPYGQTAYVTVNSWLQETLEHYQSQGGSRVLLIDTFSYIGRSIGSDGVHVTINSCIHWYNAIVSHAEENDLLP